MDNRMKALNFQIIFILFLGFIINSCAPNQNTESDKSTPPAAVKQIQTPLFIADSAYSFAQIQVDFGPRSMNSKSHEACADYLIKKSREYADTVFVQSTQLKLWTKKLVDAKNIILSMSPEKQNRILLCAHWDSRNWADQDTVRKDEPVDAANDGAAGVGVLLEVARLLKNNKPEIGVDIIFLDAEDQGESNDESTWCLGTQYWASNPHVPGYFAKYGILLDMVGAENAVFTQEAVSMQYASSVVEKVWSTAGRIGFSDYFIYKQTNGITDDHFYINTMAHIPCIDIIQYDESTTSHFYKNWHTHQDKMQFIDKKTLHAVGQTLLEVIFNEK